MEFFDFIFHADEYLAIVVNIFGYWTYVILFLTIFAETGLVVTPFLPGDSLLFATGTLSANNFLNIWVVYIVVFIAAVLGDAVNYWIGYKVGPKIFYKENSIFFNKTYLEKTKIFYEKHGSKAIIISRFLPILRTFAPFVAGVGKMKYKTFLSYNVVGAFLWVTSLTFLGYFFGTLTFVKENFELVIMGIVIFSILPIIVEYFRYKR